MVQINGKTNSKKNIARYDIHIRLQKLQFPVTTLKNTTCTTYFKRENRDAESTVKQTKIKIAVPNVNNMNLLFI